MGEELIFMDEQRKCFLKIESTPSEGEVAQSCPTLSDPTDCSLPGSSIHGFSRQSIGVECHCLLQKAAIDDGKPIGAAVF